METLPIKNLGVSAGVISVICDSESQLSISILGQRSKLEMPTAPGLGQFDLRVQSDSSWTGTLDLGLCLKEPNPPQFCLVQPKAIFRPR
ncbi:Uncharacterized protein TCM_041848 [Theobroma cacao]|uniref:Uncharacterized protein n=1 Tax=Theobroma cacao TaxID=3641 RepID=A0A061GX33_THECC|nr:Uncharacterized protein TCM_041848 [Theobroma cacao]